MDASWRKNRAERDGLDDNGWVSQRMIPLKVRQKSKKNYPWFKPTDHAGKKLRRGQRVTVKIAGKPVSGKILGSYPNGDCWVAISKKDVRVVPKNHVQAVTA